jgi:hypothetical protein
MAATIPAAIAKAIEDSDAINVDIEAIDGATGDTFSHCGVINSELLREGGNRIEYAINPFVKTLMENARHRDRDDNEALDLVTAAHLLERYRASPIPTAAVIYAPMLRDNDKDPSTSFIGAGGLYPSDGHLCAPLELSALSVLGRNESLKGMKIYVANVGEENFANATHRNLVIRWWDHYFRAQGAIPVSIGAKSLQASLYDALSPVTKDGQPAGDAFGPSEAKANCKPEMLSANRPNDPGVMLASSVVFQATKNYNAPIDQPVGTLVLALVWDDSCAYCDLDLYASPRAGETEKEVFYARNRIPGVGYLTKRFDEGNPRAETRGYEWITFQEPIDLRRASVWVNLYQVADGAPRIDPKVGVSGEVRVQFNGAYYSVPLKIMDVSEGNFGMDRNDIRARGQSPYWYEVRLDTLLVKYANK